MHLIIHQRDFVTLHKKCTEKPYSLLVIVSTLASDNPLHLSFNLYPLSALSPGNIDKYEYLTAEEILPFDQSRMIEKAKFSYSPYRAVL